MKQWIVILSFLAFLSACQTGPRARHAHSAGSSPSCDTPAHVDRDEVGRFVGALTRALSQRNERKLLNLSACSLDVGPPRSEVEGVGTREKVIPELLVKMQTYQWKELGELSENRFYVASVPPAPYVELVLEQRKKEGWLWVGIGHSELEVRKRIISSLP